MEEGRPCELCVVVGFQTAALFMYTGGVLADSQLRFCDPASDLSVRKCLLPRPAAHSPPIY